MINKQTPIKELPKQSPIHLRVPSHYQGQIRVPDKPASEEVVTSIKKYKLLKTIGKGFFSK